MSSATNASLPQVPTASIALDQYGGLLNVISTKGATGYWRTEKFGSHWMFVTPDGHAFWSFGIFDIVPTSNAITKYGDQDISWGPQQVRRFKSVGFNTVLDHSSLWVSPIQTCGGCAGWQNGQPEKTPAVWFIDGASYPLRNVFNYCTQSDKDIFYGVNNAYYNGYVAPSPDPFDPCFSTWFNAYLTSDSFAIAAGKSPWIIGYSLAESDFIWGFGAGSSADFATVPPGHNSPHLGWIVLVTSPAQTSNLAWSATYTDTTVYAKQALMTFLQNRYGTIAALNVAWDSSYTTFGSAGGWGSGTGLLDEDGRHSWIGSWDTLAGETTAMQTDLNDFLLIYAQKFFQVQHDAVKNNYPNKLYLGPNVVGSWGTPPRKQILQAAGQYVDVFMTSLGSLAVDDQARLDFTMQYLGDKPIASWMGFPANPDSSMSQYANPATYLAASTQSQRAQNYSQLASWFLNATVSTTVPGAGGTQPYVGLRWWAWLDNPTEKTDWGLLTLSDNFYDGVEAIIAPGVDPWGYPTGGEANNYGDFLSTVAAVSSKVKLALSTP